MSGDRTCFILLYCLIIQGGILDLWRSIYFSFQRMLAETLLAIKIIELGIKLRCYPDSRSASP